MEEKGLMEEDWNDRQVEEDNIIVRWAQEDVETLHRLLNNNKAKQLQLYGHVQRMEEGRLPKRSYEIASTRKKKTR